MIYPEKIKSRRIVHGAAIAGALAALLMAQLPASDNIILVPIEVIMVIRLGAVFQVGLKDSISKGLFIGSIATMIGRGISEFLIGWVPVAGNIINALTAASVIEFLGWAVVKDAMKNYRR
ncbi:hypothetical protein Q4E93_21125 [Flavitalea sp. BT771]|uniref:hypothetical protein n=1 Tax=Flavitalea sp. BT771 TaxID=3063329 RepID=UPI0026E1C9EA|nr:hypothetical protein [Flavitalea sp. BT771]MDO6433125.1 hypothetical protein [Flavitalea sp. BT771]MDV6221599.1 hypothetical protein [Flavitalea sp. BT771]